jgi:hypothetical protein
LPASDCQFVLSLPSAFFRVLVLFVMGRLISLNPVFKISHITQASVSEFVIDGHYYTSRQQKPPPSLSFDESRALPSPVSPTELRKRVWAAHNLPYFPFILNSPFHGVVMTSRLATSPGQIPLENDQSGFHLPSKVAKSWKSLEQTCCQICSVLHTSFRVARPKIMLMDSPPAKPSDFGYFSAHPSDKLARSAKATSLDAFVILFAHVSFCIAICRVEGDPATVSLLTSESKPRWLRKLL